MSFRSEAANVRGKLAAGDFKQPADDPYGFKGFAEQVTFGIRAEAEQRRKEELLEKQKEAYETIVDLNKKIVELEKENRELHDLVLEIETSLKSQIDKIHPVIYNIQESNKGT